MYTLHTVGRSQGGAAGTSLPSAPLRRTWLAGLAALALSSVACVHATPVTPAPVTPAEQDRLSKAIIGRWECTHTKKNDGDKKESSGGGVIFTFAPGGVFEMKFTGLATTWFELPSYSYKLEGRNVTNTSPQGAYRVDAVTGTTMELFQYDNTTVWYLAKK